MMGEEGEVPFISSSMYSIGKQQHVSAFGSIHVAYDGGQAHPTERYSQAEILPIPFIGHVIILLGHVSE